MRGKLSITKWMVSASGYGGDLQQVIGELGGERVGVTLVKCRPVLGSTPQNTLAVPHRLYS